MKRKNAPFFFHSTLKKKKHFKHSSCYLEVVFLLRNNFSTLNWSWLHYKNMNNFCNLERPTHNSRRKCFFFSYFFFSYLTCIQLSHFSFFSCSTALDWIDVPCRDHVELFCREELWRVPSQEGISGIKCLNFLLCGLLHFSWTCGFVLLMIMKVR